MADTSSGTGGTTRTVEDRRRVIDLALMRRPDIDIEALHGLLVRLGLEVDSVTLVADLDALGYEVVGVDGEGGWGDHTFGDVGEVDAFADVEAEPTTVAASPPPSGGDGAFREASSLASDDPGLGLPSAVGDDPAAGGDEAPTPLRRPTLVLGVVMILIVALVIAALVAGGGDDETTTGGGSSTSDRPSGSQSTDVSPGTAPPGPPITAPVGPGADEALGDGVDGASDFEAVEGEGLGAAPDGGPLDIFEGTWVAQDGQARLVEVDGDDGVGVALFDPGLESYRAQVRLPTLASSNGIIFWAADADAYWTLVASPLFGTFVLAEVRGANRRLIGDSGLTTTPGDTAVIGVHVTGRKVEALVNGAVVLDHEINVDPPGQGIGIGSLPGAASGTFDDLVYKADP